jgi:nitrate reductase gamma subunit
MIGLVTSGLLAQGTLPHSTLDAWIDLARGPLFRLALATCVLGLGYHLFVSLQRIVVAHRRAGDRELPVRAILASTARWLVPLRALRTNPVYGSASVLFHAGILLVPLFYVGHVRLWQVALPVPWPVIGPLAADVLSLAAIGGLVVLLVSRLLVSASRQMTATGDVLLLALLLGLAASGFWAAHPTAAPLAPRVLVLVHMLLGNAALLVTPWTKIVHCALYPLAQLIAELGWHFPAATGRHVAMALDKENEPV